jgi:arginase family enzyme
MLPRRGACRTAAPAYPAAVTLLAVDARISERTPRDLRGVALLAELLAPALGAARRVEGRRAPFGETAWEDDLAASRGLLERVRDGVGVVFDAGGRPVTLAADCALALGTLPALAALRPDARVLWLDAHSDYDTPATSGYSFLGCMSLSGATGAWDAGVGAAVAPERVVLVGTRAGPGDFDAAAQAAAGASAMTLVPVSSTTRAHVLEALGDAPVYVHLDPDVLDPAANPVPYARPGGLAPDALVDLLGAVAARGPVLGLELTAFHTDDDAARRRALGDELARAVAAALG